MMDSKGDLDELAQSFARDLRATTPADSIDPLQPNIIYRDPSIGGYHSRCSSALSDVHGFTFDTYSSEGYDVNDALCKCRDATRRVTTPTSGIFTATSYGKSRMNINQHESLVQRATSQLGSQQRDGPSSQQRRHEDEKSSMDKIRSMKRLAQVVPHRIDMLYFMSGRSANMGQRYQLTDLEKARLQDANYRKMRSSTTSKRHASGSASSGFSSSRHLRASADQSRIHQVLSRPNSPARKRIGMSGNESMAQGGIDEEIPSRQEEETPQAKPVVPVDRSRKLTIRSSYEMQTVNDPLHLESFDFNGEDPNGMSIVNKRQRMAFEAIFDDIDFDSNGKVTFNELVRGLFANISKKDAKRLMQVFDVDRNKVIDRREFVAICALNDRLCGIRTESKYDCLRLDLQNLINHLQGYRALFEMLDQDGDEKIHIDEVMLIIATAMGRDIGINDTIARTVMKSIDKDEKGFIDFVSFLTFIPFFLKLHNEMMNQDKLKLGEIRETKENIRDQLRLQRTSSPYNK